MSRLVNVSHRVAMPRAGAAAGGLAVGVLSAMGRGGGLWFGWNGEFGDDSAPGFIERGGITYATVAFPESLHERFYSGFANGTLWPLFHYFLDGFHYRDEDYEAYQAVNELYARRLLPLLRPDDVVWIHDYHLLPLAGMLRALGVTARIGLFLHIPFPGFEVLRALPVWRELTCAMLQFDLVGFQTEIDRQAFYGALEALSADLRPDGTGRVRAPGRTLTAGVFPIGVDVEGIARATDRAMTSAAVQRMREGLLGRRLIIGIDRLDYSKGLLERFEAYRDFLAEVPAEHGKVTYMQIAPLGRQSVKAYARIRDSLEQSAGRINGRFATPEWTPIRYLNRNFPHATIMGFMRTARVALVTPVRDGMNLVAKEFIAAQDAADPGVLILSDRAGAARELQQALIINPYHHRSIAQAIKQALDMPLAERCARHERLLATLRDNDVHAWNTRFRAALAGTNDVTAPSAPISLNRSRRGGAAAAG